MMKLISINNGRLIKTLKWFAGIITTIVVIVTGLSQLWLFVSPAIKKAQHQIAGTEEDVIHMKYKQTKIDSTNQVIIRNQKNIIKLIKGLSDER